MNLNDMILTKLKNFFELRQQNTIHILTCNSFVNDGWYKEFVGTYFIDDVGDKLIVYDNLVWNDLNNTLFNNLPEIVCVYQNSTIKTKRIPIVKVIDLIINSGDLITKTESMIKYADILSELQFLTFKIEEEKQLYKNFLESIKDLPIFIRRYDISSYYILLNPYRQLQVDSAEVNIFNINRPIIAKTEVSITQHNPVHFLRSACYSVYSDNILINDINNLISSSYYINSANLFKVKNSDELNFLSKANMSFVTRLKFLWHKWFKRYLK